MLHRQSVLFICTGNYYRSRFAEALFNHHAASAGLAWHATSKGFRPHLAQGDLSPLTLSALTRRGIPTHRTRPTPAALSESDLASASLVILLNGPEHRPMLENAFPAWTGCARHWNIHDIDVELPDTALPKLERDVLLLIGSLGHSLPLASRSSLALDF